MATDPIPGGRGNSMYILGGLGIALVWITTVLRFYVRACVIHSVGLDDSMMMIAACCFTIMAGGMFMLADNGFGQPASGLSTETMVKLYKATLLGELGYTVTAMFFRLCVAFFYLRLTPTRWHIWTIRIVISVSTVYTIAYFFILLFQCVPTTFFWSQFAGDTKGYCLPAMVIIGSTWGHNVASVLSDWTLNSLPFFMIIPSMMSWKMKLSAFSLLGLGSLASVGIIIRFVALTTMRPATSAVPLSPPVAWWSALEVCVGMVAANLATYRPLIKTIRKSFKGEIDQEAPQNCTFVSPSKIRWPRSKDEARPRRPTHSGYALTQGFDTIDMPYGQEMADLRAELKDGVAAEDGSSMQSEFPSVSVGRHDSHSDGTTLKSKTDGDDAV